MFYRQRLFLYALRVRGSLGLSKRAAVALRICIVQGKRWYLLEENCDHRDTPALSFRCTSFSIIRFGQPWRGTESISARRDQEGPALRLDPSRLLALLSARHSSIV